MDDKNYKYKHIKNRCPRCSNYLYSAEFSNIKYATFYKNKVQCSGCARVWTVTKDGELILYY